MTTSRPLVLIVDDAPVNIEIMAEIIGDECEVIFAVNGKRALDLARSQQPALILLDLVMPEMDGHEVCARLKADDATAAIPVVFVSARDGEEDLRQALELGAAGLLSKPIDPALARAAVRRHTRPAASS